MIFTEANGRTVIEVWRNGERDDTETQDITSEATTATATITATTRTTTTATTRTTATRTTATRTIATRTTAATKPVQVQTSEDENDEVGPQKITDKSRYNVCVRVSLSYSFPPFVIAYWMTK